MLIRQFDERAGWLQWGLGNCAEWLHYRCDFSMNAAREKIRVAHAMKTLPDIAAAFSSGRLSYSKVRAMTRVVGAHNEEELLSFALKTTTARVEERCRELRCGTVDSLDGGKTSLDNLMLLCSQHHKLVHEGGFRIERDYQHHWFFKRPDGRAVPACGYHAKDTVDDDIGEFSNLFNNPPAGGLLTGMKSFVSEPAPPAYWH